jgi:hypothetical protein
MVLQISISSIPILNFVTTPDIDWIELVKTFAIRFVSTPLQPHPSRLQKLIHVEIPK